MELVDILEKYQNDKNELVKKYVGIDLIPDHLKLTKKELNTISLDDIINNIKDYMYLKDNGDSMLLGMNTCLHCIKQKHIQDSGIDTGMCMGCKYVDDGNKCYIGDDNIWGRVTSKIYDLSSPEMELLRSELDTLYLTMYDKLLTYKKEKK